MTKFINLGGVPKVVKKKRTVFTGFIDSDKTYSEQHLSNSHDHEVVIFLGYDECYGDVFKAYDDDLNNFTLYFGIKGDEFEDNEEST